VHYSEVLRCTGGDRTGLLSYLQADAHGRISWLAWARFQRDLIQQVGRERASSFVEHLGRVAGLLSQQVPDEEELLDRAVQREWRDFTKDQSATCLDDQEGSWNDDFHKSQPLTKPSPEERARRARREAMAKQRRDAQCVAAAEDRRRAAASSKRRADRGPIPQRRGEHDAEVLDDARRSFSPSREEEEEEVFYPDEAPAGRRLHRDDEPVERAATPGSEFEGPPALSFEVIDLNHDGFIDRHEFAQAFGAALPPDQTEPRKSRTRGSKSDAPRAKTQRGTKGAKMTRAEQEDAVLKKIVEYMKSRLGTVHSVFREFDHDAGGSIDAQEFERALSRLGISLKRGELKVLMRSLDQDGDGQIQYKELLQRVKGYRHQEFARDHDPHYSKPRQRARGQAKEDQGNGKRAHSPARSPREFNVRFDDILEGAEVCDGRGSIPLEAWQAENDPAAVEEARVLAELQEADHVSDVVQTMEDTERRKQKMEARLRTAEGRSKVSRGDSLEPLTYL